MANKKTTVEEVKEAVQDMDESKVVKFMYHKGTANKIRTIKNKDEIKNILKNWLATQK